MPGLVFHSIIFWAGLCFKCTCLFRKARIPLISYIEIWFWIFKSYASQEVWNSFQNNFVILTYFILSAKEFASYSETWALENKFIINYLQNLTIISSHKSKRKWVVKETAPAVALSLLLHHFALVSSRHSRQSVLQDAVIPRRAGVDCTACPGTYSISSQKQQILVFSDCIYRDKWNVTFWPTSCKYCWLSASEGCSTWRGGQGMEHGRGEEYLLSTVTCPPFPQSVPFHKEI